MRPWPLGRLYRPVDLRPRAKVGSFDPSTPPLGGDGGKQYAHVLADSS
jgi:hypothetical protein